MADQQSSSVRDNLPFLLSVYDQVAQALAELLERSRLQPDELLVIGCSTSEVMGEHIGKAGAMEVAEQIFRAVQDVRQNHPFCPVFQCCEHLNRALVMENDTRVMYGYDRVAVVPIAKAGGSMATFAYEHMVNACVVEQVRAHAALDIGDTLIGMHLRPVAVPFRSSVKQIGHAHLTAAFTRPKLIGGARAVYE